LYSIQFPLQKAEKPESREAGKQGSGEARWQRFWKSEDGMRKSEKGIEKVEYKDKNAINFNQSHI